MTMIKLSIHPTQNNKFSASTTAFHEGEPNEFHTLHINADGESEVVIFFHNTQEMVYALQELRAVCDQKIWDRTAMPSEYEYDYAREPF
jgi:hypothetical protein